MDLKIKLREASHPFFKRKKSKKESQFDWLCGKACQGF